MRSTNPGQGLRCQRTQRILAFDGNLSPLAKAKNACKMKVILPRFSGPGRYCVGIAWDKSGCAKTSAVLACSCQPWEVFKKKKADHGSGRKPIRRRSKARRTSILPILIAIVGILSGAKRRNECRGEDGGVGQGGAVPCPRPARTLRKSLSNRLFNLLGRERIVTSANSHRIGATRPCETSTKLVPEAS